MGGNLERPAFLGLRRADLFIIFVPIRRVQAKFFSEPEAHPVL